MLIVLSALVVAASPGSSASLLEPRTREPRHQLVEHLEQSLPSEHWVFGVVGGGVLLVGGVVLGVVATAALWPCLATGCNDGAALRHPYGLFGLVVNVLAFFPALLGGTVLGLSIWRLERRHQLLERKSALEHELADGPRRVPDLPEHPSSPPRGAGLTVMIPVWRVAL